MLYNPCWKLWKETYRDRHLALASTEKWKAVRGPDTYCDETGEVSEGKLFEDVWDFVMHRWLKSLNLPAIEAVELYLPKGHFAVFDNFVVHAGAESCSIRNLYRLHIYMQRAWQRAGVVDVDARHPENAVMDFRTDPRLFPLVRCICKEFKL